MTSANPSFWRDLGVNLKSGVRLAALMVRRLRRADFRVSPDQLVALAIVQLMLNLLVSLTANGSGGVLNPAALPGEIFFIALLVLAGYLIARMQGDMSIALAIPVVALTTAPAFTVVYLGVAAIAGGGDATGISANIGEILGNALPFPRHEIYSALYTAYLVWALAVTIAGVILVTGWRLPKTLAAIALIVALGIMPQWFFPAGELWVAAADEDIRAGLPSAASENVLEAQPRLLGAQLAALAPQRPGVADLYFVGFAPYASQDVFMKETQAVKKLFDERFDTAGRSIALINNAQTLAETPLATTTHLARTLEEIAGIMDAEEDMLFLFITTHGSQFHELQVEFEPLRLNQVDAGFLRDALVRAGIKWRIIAISACYSGGFVAPLKNENTLIMTAADARNTSFGCENEADFTWFGRALFDEQLRTKYSFSDAFAGALETIAQWENEQGYTHSQPQIEVGAAIAPKLEALETRLRRDRDRVLAHLLRDPVTQGKESFPR
ncbi:MAG: C13 family peptidase [Pseudomonadota bacterium]|nr:C13 family peptidase [Pseudomonadota bacterium]